MVQENSADDKKLSPVKKTYGQDTH